MVMGILVGAPLSYQFVYLNISQVIMTALFILYVAVFTYLADW